MKCHELIVKLISFEHYFSALVITTSTLAGGFAITDTKLYVPVVVTLPTQDNAKLLQ